MKRIDSQLFILRNALRGTGWWTLEQLCEATGQIPTSCSANLRHLRKKKHGGYTIERRLNGGVNEYRLRAE